MILKKKILKKDVLFYLSAIIGNVGFSKNLTLTSAKQLSKNRLVSNFKYGLKTQQINTKLKMTKFKLKKFKNAGFLNGFYRAVW
jgi:hypothetical protein